MKPTDDLKLSAFESCAELAYLCSPGFIAIRPRCLILEKRESEPLSFVGEQKASDL